MQEISFIPHGIFSTMSIAFKPYIFYIVNHFSIGNDVIMKYFFSKLKWGLNTNDECASLDKRSNN